MYPEVKDPRKVGEYPARAYAGGGYVWDEVLEYRVWGHDEDGPFYYTFEDAVSAIKFSEEKDGVDEPLALVLQKEYIDEPNDGVYVHVKEERVTEWPLQFLSRPKRSENTIPDFLAPDAPENRLDIIRGIA